LAPAIVWFRQDLRVDDNPALLMASAHGREIIPVFILDDETPGRWSFGGAARWWLHGSLTSLRACLAALGAPLVLRRGRAERELDRLIAESGAKGVFWNRCYEPFAIERDRRIKVRLKQHGIEVQSGNAALLHEPFSTATAEGAPFRVYSPFARACLARGQPEPPCGAPVRLRARKIGPPSERLEDWSLLPAKPDWAGGLRATWRPGEAAAVERLGRFLDLALGTYVARRHRPDLEFTSRLSPHLHFGEISVRRVWHVIEAAKHARGTAGASRGGDKFQRELLWREFAHHLLFHVPDFPEAPLERDFAEIPWRDDPAALSAWRHGQTGYPFVDAGMRELRVSGWMHNRARMTVASFLAKHLLLPWQAGAAWFWDELVDADLANNSLGWQWAAGAGPDAAPYVRMFNPVLQGEKFDPDGAYVRRFIPELDRLPAAVIHKPWQAPATVLREAGVRLGATYPLPMVDHRQARERALAAFAARSERRRYRK
jgi:deoxyribodipyrimidine photo-lyase